MALHNSLQQPLLWLQLHRRIFMLLIAGFFIGVGISVVYRGGFSEKQRTDLPVFLRAAEAVESGHNIYDVKTERQWNYVYLPLLAIALVPFIHLPMVAAVFFWYLLSVAALAWVFFLSMKFVKDPSEGFSAACIASILCIPPYLNTLTRGQLGVLVLFAMLAVFYLYLKKRDLAAGILLAFTVVLKSSPAAPLVFFFLFKREWKVLLSFAAGVFVFLIVLPSLAVGWERNLFFLGEYYRIMDHAMSDQGHQSLIWAQLVTPFAEDNQSIYAVLMRSIWGSESAFIGNSNAPVRLGTRAAGALAILFLGLTAAGKRERTDTKRLLLEYSLFPVIMLLVSPATQPHHYTVLYLVFFAALLYLMELPAGSPGYTALAAAVGIGAFSFLFGLIFERLSWWGLPALGSLTAWLILFVFLLRENASQRNRIPAS